MRWQRTMILTVIFLCVGLMIPATTLAQTPFPPSTAPEPPTPPAEPGVRARPPVLTAELLGRLARQAPHAERTPFSNRMEVPLLRLWDGRLRFAGFRSETTYPLVRPGSTALELAERSALPQRGRFPGMTNTSLGFHFSFSFGPSGRKPASRIH